MGQARAPLVLTCGEPAGIAPEITALAWSVLAAEGPPFALFGDASYIAARAKAANLSLPVERIEGLDQASGIFKTALPVLHRPLPEAPQPGHIAPATAAAVIASIDEAVALTSSGAARAMVTNPIHKDALYAAGFRHQGHTDYIASLVAGKGPPPQEVMMLIADDLRAVPVTVHIALAAVPKQLTTKLIIDQGRVVARDLIHRFGIAAPRLAMTGLNPHAGENGAMGHEEQTIIAPAIAQLRHEGLNVMGPLPADTAFHAEARATYDAILCMYHDQALIPVKTLDFHGGVNVTLGLPFVRTSPDHGTALGLAGTGRANPKSLIAALRLADELSRTP